MSREMIINASVPQNVRVAVVLDGRVEAFFEEFQQDFRTRGNIYMGQVINVENSLDACFVDYGEARHGFLPMSEILPQYWNKRSKEKESVKKVDQAVRRGQKLLVQVDKEPAGTKGARLTTQISLAGRYLVLMPDSDTRGVSRRIEDPEQRREFKKMTEALSPPKNMGLIVRTAGMGRAKRDLSRDMNFLLRLWKKIQASLKQASKPGLLHADADLIQRILRDYYSNLIERVWIDDSVAMNKAEEFFRLYMPRQRHNLKAYTDKKPIFSHFGIEEQLDALHARRVPLPSGGSLVIDPTEALVAIDVNSGKTKNKQGQEGTAQKTNLEAAKEIARQLRLRDLGGIIVIDFIDMQQSAYKKAVEKALREAMKPDKARSKISKISAFGLCTLTRQRLGKSTHSAGQIPCPTCHGNGVVRDPESSTVHILRRIRAQAATGDVGLLRIRMAGELANHIQNKHRADILATEKEYGLTIEILAAELQLGREEMESQGRPKEGRSRARSGASEASQGADSPSESAPKRKRRRRKKKSSQESAQAESAKGDANGEEQQQKPQQTETEPTKEGEKDSPEGEPKKRAKKSSRRRGRKKKPASGEEAQQDPVSTAEVGQEETQKQDEGKGEKPAAPRRRRRRRKKKPGASSDLKSDAD